MTLITDRIRNARLKLLRERPYYGTALWKLTMIPSSDCPTAAVDKYWRCYYNTTWCNEKNVDELEFLLWHEVTHLLKDHCHRSERFLKANSNIPVDVWRIAVDLDVHNESSHPGKFIEGGMKHADYGMQTGLMAEQYARLLKDHPKCQQPADGQPGGSCADGIPRPWEGPCDGDCVTHEKAEMIRRVVAKEIQDAAKAKGRGSVPSDMLVWADAVLTPPKVSWQSKLQSSIRHSVGHQMGRGIYTFTRPNRRQQAYGSLLMPAPRQPVPSIAVIVDTSGSMSLDRGQRALSELQGIIKSVHTGVHVLSCDADVAACQKAFTMKQVITTGGGGTDMGRGITAAMKLKPRPQTLIVLTDGDTPWPDKAPACKLIVVLVDKPSQMPPFGEVIEVE